MNKEVIVVGGGLAGLVTALQLNQQDREILLIEKKQYPFHRVCGEYISNEVLQFMDKKGYLPDLELPSIKQFTLTSVHGREASTPLDLGGFGVSRYSLDHHLYNLAKARGIEVMTGTNVLDVQYDSEYYQIKTDKKSFQSKIVIGAFGKRSNIDNKLNRSFFNKRSPYIGVKYHAYADIDDDRISLHNFEGGYCGVSRVENDITNICYLSKVENLKKFGSIEEMEQNILYQNPHLKKLFTRSEFIFDKPEVINEISFETKGPVEEGILMAGDAAGMITPLCGNGMAMAIHGAKILSEEVNQYLDKPNMAKSELEANYRVRWERQFKRRLQIGRNVQKLFGNPRFSTLSVNLIRSVKPLSNLIIKNTHGQPIHA